MLNLPLPAQLYSCQVYDYTVSHSRLVIRLDGWNVLNEMQTFYLYFSSVRYFSGPTLWEGANFQLASEDQCIATMQRVGLLKRWRPRIIDHLNLYTINENDVEVKIISSRFKLSTKKPYY